MLNGKAKHSGTLGTLVVYRAPNGSVWARPHSLSET
ncbi:DUF1653 domain-containing protein [Alicyclobacillus tolerans]